MDWIVYFGLWSVLLFFFIVERLMPAHNEKVNPRWLILAMVINVLQISAVWTASVTFNRWLPHCSLTLLPSHWPTFVAAMFGAGLYSFAIYWYHRAEHALPFLWRMHQLHHSTSRMEALSTNYAHPLEYLTNTLVHSIISFGILGLSSEATALSYGLAGAQNFFIHSNLRSPQWLGYIVQRPEMHRIHHQYGHHRDNYGLPVWDFIFGTWINPDKRIASCGFSMKEEERVLDMLIFKDVHVSN